MFNLFGKSNNQTEIQQLNVADFEKLRAANDANTVVLDVRTAEEFAEGSVPNAKLIDVNGVDFTSETANLDPTKKYLIYCRSGVRSMKACSYLAGKGFEDLSNLLGGYMAWSSEKA